VLALPAMPHKSLNREGRAGQHGPSLGGHTHKRSEIQLTDTHTEETHRQRDPRSDKPIDREERRTGAFAIDQTNEIVLHSELDRVRQSERQGGP